MAAPESTLHYLLGSKTRARFIEQLVTHDYDAEPLWMREVYRRAQSGFSGLYRERTTLQQLGLLRTYHQGPILCFAVNRDHALHAPLKGLVEAAQEMDERRGGPPRFVPPPNYDPLRSPRRI